MSIVLLVTGSRDISEAPWVEARIERALQAWGISLADVDVMLLGRTTNVESAALAWATKKGLSVRVREVDWGKDGRPAACALRERDRALVKEATHVIALSDGASLDTEALIESAMTQKKLVLVFRHRKHA